MRDVDHVVIGAGLAGLTLARFLRGKRVVVLDPAPAGYKIGESLIPELFRHPELLELVPRLAELPSYTAKLGTTFVSRDEFVYFPLAESEQGVSMHIARAEMERLMMETWSIPVTEAAVVDVDIEGGVVKTSEGEYRSRGPILDCSGPAMVVARALGQIENILEVFTTWAYYDIVQLHDDRFAEQVAGRGSFAQYDARHRRIINSSSPSGWRPSHTTQLTRVDGGLWTWQIPLFGARRVSYGVVSRHGPVDEAEYRRVAETHASPALELRRRPSGDTPYDRLHVRNGFARRAKRAADRGYILLSDAFAFSDPVYSVGTGFAVNQAIRVANMLRRSPWNEDDCRSYCDWCEALIGRARRAFEFWYRGDVLTSPAASAEVQENFLQGNLFHREVTHHYGTVLENSELGDGSEQAEDPFAARWAAQPFDTEVLELLELDSTGQIEGWKPTRAQPTPRGLSVHWRRGTEELVVLVALDPDGNAPKFRELPGLALSYMEGLGGPGTSRARLEQFFDALGPLVAARAEAWRALLARD